MLVRVSPVLHHLLVIVVVVMGLLGLDQEQVVATVPSAGIHSAMATGIRLIALATHQRDGRVGAIAGHALQEDGERTGELLLQLELLAEGLLVSGKGEGISK